LSASQIKISNQTLTNQIFGSTQVLMTEEQEIELKKELVNRMASNLTFGELIDIVSALASNEVNKQFASMPEEEKNQAYREIFEKEV